MSELQCTQTMECHPASGKEEVLLCTKQGCTQETSRQLKEARQGRGHVVGFHSYAMPRAGEPTETESRWVAAGGWEESTWVITLGDGRRGSFRGN